VVARPSCRHTKLCGWYPRRLYREMAALVEEEVLWQLMTCAAQVAKEQTIRAPEIESREDAELPSKAPGIWSVVAEQPPVPAAAAMNLASSRSPAGWGRSWPAGSVGPIPQSPPIPTPPPPVLAVPEPQETAENEVWHLAPPGSLPGTLKRTNRPTLGQWMAVEVPPGLPLPAMTPAGTTDLTREAAFFRTPLRAMSPEEVSLSQPTPQAVPSPRPPHLPPPPPSPPPAALRVEMATSPLKMTSTAPVASVSSAIHSPAVLVPRAASSLSSTSSQSLLSEGEWDAQSTGEIHRKRWHVARAAGWALHGVTHISGTEDESEATTAAGSPSSSTTSLAPRVSRSRLADAGLDLSAGQVQSPGERRRELPPRPIPLSSAAAPRQNHRYRHVSADEDGLSVSNMVRAVAYA
jgi:hypothetical protein